MNKLVLFDLTSIDINEEDSEYSFSKSFASFEDLKNVVNVLTETNLSSYKIKNSADIVSATYSNKKLVSSNTSIDWDDDENIRCLSVVFKLEDVNLLEKELKNLRNSQKAQNSAILELATLITELKGAPNND